MAAWYARFLLGAIVAACLGWLWLRGGAPGLAGLALAALAGALLLLVGFGVMHAVNRRDAAPRARAGQLLAAWLRELGASLRLFWWLQPFRHGAQPDWLPAAPTGRRGVVLVHGFLCNRALWNGWAPLLRARGHAFVAVDLEPVFTSIDAYADTVEAAVRRIEQATGLPPVLVCHSMGGLAARAWLRHFAADDRVHRVITLGTPHGGTWPGRFSHAPNGRQMALDGPWVRALAASEPPARARRFVCWYSNCDNVVFPAHTATLAGADNRFIAGQAHIAMVHHRQVQADCLALLE